MEALVRVDGLRKTYGDIEAVQNLSFTVHQGDIYGFLGQNGAGKSTTIRMLLGLVTPSEGSIEMFGYRLPHHRREILRQVGAIIERPDLYTYLSAYHNLDMMARLSGMRPTRRQLMDQLEAVNLHQRAHSPVKTFSQGMKQRLGIAISLIHNPALVILDEPTNGLDPQGIADMRQLILNLRREHKKTVIVSSHLLHEVEQVATRMIIIHQGRKVVEGSTAELFNPARTLVALETSDSGAPEKLGRSPWAGTWQAQGGFLVFTLHENQIPTLARDLVAMDIPIGGLKRMHSLESLFLSLTAEQENIPALAD